MVNRERFRKLAELKRKKEDEEKLKKEIETGERIKLGKVIIPQIERVCEEFAVGVGWTFEEDRRRSEDEILKDFSEFRPVNYDIYEGRADGSRAVSWELTLTPLELTISVKIAPIKCSHRGVLGNIPVVSFTEEEFAQLLETIYKQIYGM